MRRPKQIWPKGEKSEIFTYVGVKYNVTAAKELPGEIVEIDVNPEWSAMVYIDKKYAEKTECTDPVILAPIFLQGQRFSVMIDGHHRHAKALAKGQKKIKAKVLSVRDSFKIMFSTPNLIKTMWKEAKTYAEVAKDT